MKLPSSSPILTPEDLGLDLEEDSPDVSEEDVSNAIETDTETDFQGKVVQFITRQSVTGSVSFDLRRKGGILFCCMKVGDLRQFFRTEWLRSK